MNTTCEDINTLYENSIINYMEQELKNDHTNQIDYATGVMFGSLGALSNTLKKQTQQQWQLYTGMINNTIVQLRDGSTNWWLNHDGELYRNTSHNQTLQHPHPPMGTNIWKWIHLYNNLIRTGGFTLTEKQTQALYDPACLNNTIYRNLALNHTFLTKTELENLTQP